MTDGDALFVSPSSLAVPLIALGAQATILGPKGERTVAVEDLYQVPKKQGDRELTIAHGEVLTKVTIPAAKGKNASYEARQKQAHDWPLVLASVHLSLDGDKVAQAPASSWAASLRSPGGASRPRRRSPARRSPWRPPPPRARPQPRAAKPLSMNGYKVVLTRTVVKRALLAAVGNRYWEEA